MHLFASMGFEIFDASMAGGSANLERSMNNMKKNNDAS